eukprot:c28522_g1_i1 orf=385-3000(-)
MAEQFDSQPAIGNSVTGGGNSTEMDEKIATMLHLQQLQQKQQISQHMDSHSVNNADAAFRRGLEELVRDHLNTCMALASCSSAHEPGVGSSSSDNMLDDVDDQCHIYQYHSPRRRDDGQLQHGNGNSQQEEVEEGNTQLVHGCAHNSLVRRQVRILSGWAVCHAQEMITTIERQAREAELLALAGLHAVSMLDASFLRESSQRSEPAAVTENSVERPRRRAASLVQMWGDLEEEHRAQRANNLENRVAFQGASTVNFSERNDEFQDAQESHNSARVHESGLDVEIREDQQDQTQESELTGFSSREALDSDNGSWEVAEGALQAEVHGNGDELEGNVPQMGGSDREPVRQIVQRLLTEAGTRDDSSNRMHNDNRTSWLGENERERVRELAREWVRVTSQPSMDSWEGRRRAPERFGLQLGSVRRQAREREGVSEAASARNSEPDFSDRFSRDAQWFQDRQAALDLLMRIERERQNELQGLLEHRAVSEFAHRNRLQSFLRGRFLRTGTTNEEELASSSAAGELGQLRQRRAVTGLREGFRYRLETVLLNQANRPSESSTTAEDEVQRRRDVTQQVIQETDEANDAEDRETHQHGEWQGITTARRFSELRSLEEATAYNMELQELLGRRSVTNILASEFRDRLDQLIRSFIHSQGRTTVAWDFARPGQTANAPQQQQQEEEQVEEQEEEVHVEIHNDEQIVNPPEVVPFAAPPPPPPPPPPPQPLWQQELQQTAWVRPTFRRPSLMDWESINELRADVTKLQQGLSGLERMMETCLEMQLELQRSVRQEVAGALHQMYVGKAVPEDAIDGSKWVTVKKGTCCVCCDKNIDSLLYRCGHMCTCLKCASELMRNSGKCPMCRAPIVEVIRAFTVA